MNSDDLAPVLVAPPAYYEARKRVRAALGFPTERWPLLIGIDGTDGSGKSSLAAWLSWQLEMPAINLDTYLVERAKRVTHRTEELAAVLGSRQRLKRPVIVEGVLLLDTLKAVQRSPDFLIFAAREGGPSPMAEVHSYLKRARPHERADFTVSWSSAEHDAAVMRAHDQRSSND